MKSALAERLRAELETREVAGEIDVDFFALELHVPRAVLNDALEILAASGYVEVEERWQCPACNLSANHAHKSCSDCGRPREGTEAVLRTYLRSYERETRDPSAVFLIHGMNTLGGWQESLSWKVQLIYGYSVPVFNFKFGQDRTSPLSLWSQERRTGQLGRAIRRAQKDLAASGRATPCDIIAHSFGTLLVARLLEHPDFKDLEFGRVILSGSIVRRDYEWKRFADRVEAVLNHRAGRDRWVRVSPWIFPLTDSSGYHGFRDRSIDETLSEDFGHSDYFSSQNFPNVVRHIWAAFINGKSFPAGHSAPAGMSIAGPRLSSRRFWVGRLLLMALAYAAWISLQSLT